MLRACSPAVVVVAAAGAAGDAAGAPASPRLPQREPMDSWYEACCLFFVCGVYYSALTTLALPPLAVYVSLLVKADLMGNDDDDDEMMMTMMRRWSAVGVQAACARACGT